MITGHLSSVVSDGCLSPPDFYPRATPEMWPGIILKSKKGGADVIQTYVFWNGHEPVRGQYYFEGRYDLVKFVKLIGSSGLYLHLRIGPYACAEWNFGGFPVWLRDIQGIEFRTNNGPFKFFGGTNFDRTAGGPFQITSYDYDAPIDEYGLLSEPKWGHLKDLHTAIKLCEPALVTVDQEPQYFKLGPMQEAHIYSNVHLKMNERLPGNLSICSAFLANIDEHKSVAVQLFGNQYTLLPWSVIILPDCKTVAFNTAQVGSQISIKTSSSLSSSYSNTTAPGNLLLATKDFSLSSAWMAFSEPIGIWNDNCFTAQQILQHLNVTKDASDYLWYITRINVSDEDITYWKENGILPALTIHSIRDVAQIFLNGQLIGGAYGNWVKLRQTLQLVEGRNELALVSETIGVKNYGAFIEKDGAGFRGPIKLIGFKDGEIDLSSASWTYQVGLKGEFVKVFAPEDPEKVDWTILQPDKKKTPFTWYKSYFDAPSGNDTIALDLGNMGKGQAWVNGHGLGRYWSLVAPNYGCPETCNYRGAYNEKKCLTNCGKPTQTLYHIPREWLEASNNLLIIFEETGGNPLGIKLKKHATSTICAKVSETHYPPLSSWHNPEPFNRNISLNKSSPEMYLHCDDGYIISSIKFASFGTPRGSCQNFSEGKCHAESSSPVISKACLGRNRCYITVSITTFSPDPCRGTVKTLAVQAECSPPSDHYTHSSF